MLRIVLRWLLVGEHPALSWHPSYSSLAASPLQGLTSSPITSSSLEVTLLSLCLSWSVDEKSLKDAFSSFGEVTEVRIMYDKNSGRSRGFGFVHFSNHDQARCAKDAMDGKAFLGRPLRINFAFDKVRGEPIVVSRISMAGTSVGKSPVLAGWQRHGFIQGLGTN
ncbi:unnamed protein product [Spirodela intermedia]|uniref:RRM domain-containing protein n=1 Tax=Spirodela intermedia TaxID=51605 RepID=A0A7I8JSR3_SPIIN|nr:unnamed protein product [Spirodela intermedia]CAA6673230.1 unnamed protein product [Spirodela intermedia]